jgi:hypothetical protein
MECKGKLLPPKRVIAWGIWTMAWGVFSSWLIFGIKMDSVHSFLIGWGVGTIGGFIFVDRIK